MGLVSTCPWCNGILVQTAALSDARGVSAVCPDGHTWDVVAWQFDDDGTARFELGMLVWPMPLTAQVAADKEPPMFMEPVVGYRAWMVNRVTLQSVGHTSRSWRPGENVAVCAVGGKHSAPDPTCTCGLYAYHDLKSVGNGVKGAIVAYGALDVHRAGFRAEKARIVALAHRNDSTTAWPYTDTRVDAAVPDVARRYGVPVVDEANLEVVAREHGAPLPKSALPDHLLGIRPGTMFANDIVAVRWMSGDYWRCRCARCHITFTARARDLDVGKVKCVCAGDGRVKGVGT